MRDIVRYLFFILPLSFAINGVAQDIQLSQYYNVSPLMNPAFAGTAYSYRAIANVRSQWNALDANYQTYIASVDYNWRKYNSGLGAFIVHDEQGDGIVQRTEFALQYAYWVNFGKDSYLRMAIQPSYNQRSIGNNLTFPDQFNGSGFDKMTDGEIRSLPNVNYVDFSAGALYYNKNFWAGFSAYHLNQPNHSFLGENEPIDTRFNFIMGYKFIINERPTMRYLESKNVELLSITPSLNYKSQGKSDQLDIGAYMFYKLVMAGVWYRGIPVKNEDNIINNESIIILAGLKFDQLSFTYSFDKVISNLRENSVGAHEFNIIYQFPKNNKKPKKPMKLMPCPTFVGEN